MPLPIRFMLKITFLVLILCLLLSCSRLEQEQENYVVGIVNPNPGVKDIPLGFIEGLSHYGFVEGKNIRYIRALGPADLDKTLKEMIASNVDLIFTFSTPATKKVFTAVKDKGIPVVFALYDPVAGGVIKSLANPGENITGIQIRGSTGKALEWLLLVAPGIKNVFVPVKFDSPATKLSLADLRKAATIEGVNIFVHELADPADIAEAFKNNGRNMDAVFLLNSIFVSSNAGKIAAEAIKYKLPSGGGISTSSEGVMITYGVFSEKVGKQASRQANLILRGKPAREIPAEVAEFFLSINMDTAHKAGISIPNYILIQADDIIPYEGKKSP